MGSLRDVSDFGWSAFPFFPSPPKPCSVNDGGILLDADIYPLACLHAQRSQIAGSHHDPAVVCCNWWACAHRRQSCCLWGPRLQPIGGSHSMRGRWTHTDFS
ncbi:hypothetical protein B296_00058303 [Ensete ventricosum]|uniref:Uncharacterized protein n=1 Tax=Ensete ventricosum TaxID=4639 RepID=A0A426XMN9_ENSVE|nr:hypothetical protein B296_00058303 [Ensete ventricosum]